MNTRIIEATKSSPRIELKPEGEIIIHGRSIIEDTYTFYKPVIEWIKAADCRVMTVEIRMEYMNTSSSKQLLTVLKTVAANPNLVRYMLNGFTRKMMRICWMLAKITNRSSTFLSIFTNTPANPFNSFQS